MRNIKRTIKKKVNEKFDSYIEPRKKWTIIRNKFFFLASKQIIRGLTIS